MEAITSAMLPVRLIDVQFAYGETCHISEGSCASRFPIRKRFIAAAIAFASAQGIAVAGELDRGSGDDVLQNIRDGHADITPPFFVPRENRLGNISVISAPLYYHESGFLVNRALVSSEHDTSYAKILRWDVWIIVAFWRLSMLVFPSIPKNITKTYGAKWAVVLLAVLGMFAKIFYSKKILANTFNSYSLPFASMLQASRFLHANPESMMLFPGGPYGGADLSLLHNQFKIVDESTLLHRIEANRYLFSYNNLPFLVGIAGNSPKVTTVKSDAPATHDVSFCLPGFHHREKITYAYELVNEAGLTYGKEAWRPTLPKPKPYPMRIYHAGSGLKVWSGCVLLTVFGLVMELLLHMRLKRRN